MPVQIEWANERQWRLAMTEALEDWNEGLRDNMVDLAQLAEREAFVRCPVKTGRLRAGIETEIDNLPDSVTLLLYDDVKYAAFVEFGTRFAAAQPFLRPGLAAAQAAYERDMVRGLR